MSTDRSSAKPATIGVAANGNSAELVTVAGRDVVDRRRVDLTPPGTPTHPYHHEGAWAVGRYLDTPGARPVTMAEAVALVERVHALAAEGARAALDAVAHAVPATIAGIALRACAPLPPTIEATIRDHRAHTMADSILYRRACAAAAEARGWAVHWYEKDSVPSAAAAALGGADLDAVLAEMGRALGPPWRAAHKLAAAAALAAAGVAASARPAGTRPKRK
jgi:hypothetical protein